VLWVFDVDGCLIDSLSGTSLRPGAVALLVGLRSAGHRIVLWSAGGADYAHQRAVAHGIADHIDEFHGKDARDQHRRYVAQPFVDDLDGVVFVDDQPEDMPIDAEVIPVSPYISPNPHDRALDAVLAAARASRAAP